jgi:hypothetical protein
MRAEKIELKVLEMVKFVPSIIMFISSYSPLGLILVIKDFDFLNKKFNNPIISLVILVIIVISIIILFIIVSNIKNGNLIKITKISNKSSELINYSIPYVISFIGINLANLSDLISFIIFMTFMYILTVNTQSIFLNPVLALCKYGLYDVEYIENDIQKQGVFLSKKELFNNKNYTIRKISKFMYFITKDINLEEDN